MFIGHFGLSFAAKKVAPKVSLATLFIATQFVDILWPFLLVFGIEKVAVTPGYTKTNAFEFLHYPYTHSLLMGFVWGAVVGLSYWLFKKDTRGAIVVGICVLSHWLLDVIVHVADLPLSPFIEYKVGFGLWNHVVITLLLETIIFLAGAYIYGNFTNAKNKIGKYGLWSLVILLILVTVSNTFGPPPPNSVMILFYSFIILMVIIVSLAYWVDKNREIVDQSK
jgi:membrane-bound metal-dependent hydrolase YbcI (DUF457 family)